MAAQVRTVAFHGIEVLEVETQVTITSGLPVFSAHIVVDPEVIASGQGAVMLDALQDCLRGHFDVEHSTFQLEPAGHADHERPMHG